MEKQILLFLLAQFAGFEITVAAECENGWTAYIDEVCIKALTTSLLTYDEAQQLCSAQSDGSSQGTLAMVKKSEMHELLVNLTEDIYDNFWLGGTYDAETSQFRWSNGEPLSFTNWAEGYPRNTTDSELCIQMRPPNAKTSTELEGKWEDTSCQRRNAAICQRNLLWSLQDAVNAIFVLREEQKVANEKQQATDEELRATKVDLQATKGELQAVKEELQVTKGELDMVNSRVVPVGSIYIEYYGQPSPASLWPSLTWEDVTTTYAGLFFRASGGGAAGWGESQPECAPRTTQTVYSSHPNGSLIENPLNIPTNGWSGYGYTGEIYTPGTHWWEGLQFYTSGCEEIRPNNQAFLIWKRAA